jgi:hypothetical protein
MATMMAMTCAAAGETPNKRAMMEMTNAAMDHSFRKSQIGRAWKATMAASVVRTAMAIRAAPEDSF